MNGLFIILNKISSASARRVFLFAVAVLLGGTLQSCSLLKNISEGVLHPMTPEESRAQVVDAARDIVVTLGLKGVSAIFSHDSCNDQGDAPFHGRVRLDYDHAPTLDESRQEIQRMLTKLRQYGWSTPNDFHSHAPAVSKHNVTARFAPYSPVQDFGGFVEFLGECRDMTTEKDSVPVSIPADELS